mgnify:CR=1 FL=1
MELLDFCTILRALVFVYGFKERKKGAGTYPRWLL